MLSYTLSMAIVIILLLCGIRYLLRGYFPAAYKASGRLSKLMRRGAMKLIRRLGWGRTLLIMYLLLAVISTMAILLNFFDDLLENVGKLTIIWLPLVGIWRIRKFLKEHWERRYRLPGRRN